MSETVAAALADVSVNGRTCLEAGAGAGNATATLRDRGATPVLAVTNDAEHAGTVSARFAGDDGAETLYADLRSVPLPDDAVDLVTAHALFNVVATTEIAAMVAELTRVTAPGGELVVDDYDPLPAGPVRELFGVANAVGELVGSRPTYTFYSRTHLRRLFEGHGWRHERTKTLLDPVPWDGELLDTHERLTEEDAAALSEGLAESLCERAAAARDRAGDGVDAGKMYSLRFRLPG